MLGEGLSKAGYTRRPAVAYFEKTEPATGTTANLLEELGAYPSRVTCGARWPGWRRRRT